MTVSYHYLHHHIQWSLRSQLGEALLQLLRELERVDCVHAR